MLVQIKIIVAIALLFNSFKPFVVRGQGTWEKVDVPVTVHLRSLSFADSLYGWIAGDSGTIVHTTDGGVSWIQQESQTMYDVRKIFFIDRDTGWATAFNFSQPPYGTELLSTVNGGEVWTKTTYPEDNVFMNALYYFNGQHGWMGGLPHALVYTSNGGGSWQQAAIDTTPMTFFPVININFYDESYGYACGGLHDIAGVVWYTSNGGNSWGSIEPEFAPADEIYQVHPFDSLHVLAVGGDPDFAFGFSTLRTYDGGITWTYDEPGIQGNAFDVDVINGNEVWCPMGWQRSLLYSADSGYSWTDFPAPDSTEIFDIEFTDNKHGYGVGQNGAVIRYSPPTSVGMESGYYNIERGGRLFQNVPNPFSRSTRIPFTVPESESVTEYRHVRIRLFDASGTLMEVITDRYFVGGNHVIEFNRKGLPPGLYYYNLELETDRSRWKHLETKKMIVL
jgi:photosystem II stability/assembly factor-like uncharacterized protein